MAYTHPLLVEMDRHNWKLDEVHAQTSSRRAWTMGTEPYAAKLVFRPEPTLVRKVPEKVSSAKRVGFALVGLLYGKIRRERALSFRRERANTFILRGPSSPKGPLRLEGLEGGLSPEWNRHPRFEVKTPPEPSERIIIVAHDASGKQAVEAVLKDYQNVNGQLPMLKRLKRAIVGKVAV